MISTSPRHKEKSFRADINGLRAWAVIAVVFYHFSLAGFGGGFVGVDVFFVISGFLMSGIIYDGLNQGEFSLVSFYLARARRIIPALGMLSLVLLVVGWFVLPPVDYSKLGRHIASALGFFSNIQFWSEAGYFDTASHEKWLLHTWSLSVEWQFYMLLPLIMAGVWKFRPDKNLLVLILVALFAGSLYLSATLSVTNSSAAFYLLPMRAWEMLAGGLVFLVANKFKYTETFRRILEFIGFSLIVYSILFFKATDVWPGYLALIPVIGTMMVLLANRDRSVFTSTFVAQWVGTRSYSIYLWHWPIVVGLVYLEYLDSPIAVGMGLIATLALGVLSFSFVEKSTLLSFRRFPRNTSVFAYMVLLVVIALPGLVVDSVGGVNGRISSSAELAFAQAQNMNERHEVCKHFDHSKVYEEGEVTGCRYGDGKLAAIVIGDSHAAALVKAVEQAIPNKSGYVLQWTLDACPTVLTSKTMDGRNECGKFVEWTLAQQKKLPKDAPIIIVNRTSLYAFGPNESDDVVKGLLAPMYFESPDKRGLSEHLSKMRAGIINTACEYAKTREVYLVRPIPEMKINVPQISGRALLFGMNRNIAISMSEYKERHNFVWEAQDAAKEACGVKILDPLPYLCRGDKCYAAVNGVPIYYDDDHLNLRGDAIIAPMFARMFHNLTANQ